MIGRRLCCLCLNTISRHIDNNKNRLYSSASRLTNADVRKKRNAIFDEETQRQRTNFVKRVEKIDVVVEDSGNEYNLAMNKLLSTPYNCAMHIREFLMKRSIVAIVNDVPWDMHRPLEENCTVQFRHVLDEDPTLPNEVFWRTGSFVLGHILETSFKEENYVELCSFPVTSIESGCFVYDVDLKIPDWKPTQRELLSLGMVGGRLCYHDWRFERLEMDASVAQRMFEDNRFKSEQIPMIAGNNNNHVTVHRMGEHIDITDGPLIANSSQFYRFQVTAINPIESQKYGQLHRVQALALPNELQMHWWAWEFLCKRASKPVMKLLPDSLLEKMKPVESIGGEEVPLIATPISPANKGANVQL